MDELQKNINVLTEKNKQYETIIKQLTQIPKEKRSSANNFKLLQYKNQIAKNKKAINFIKQHINARRLESRITQFGQTKDDEKINQKVDSLIESQKKQELEEQNKKDLTELNALESLDSKGLLDSKKGNLFTPEEDNVNALEQELDRIKKEREETKIKMKQDEEDKRKNEEETKIKMKQDEEELNKRKAEEFERNREREFEEQLKEYELTRKRKINQNVKTRKNKNKQKEIQMVTINKQKPTQPINLSQLSPSPVYEDKKKKKEIQMITKKGPSEDISTPEYESIMGIKPTIDLSQNLNKTGFKESLKQKTNQKQTQISINGNYICPAIFKSGKNVTKKYYFPSEFPNLTKLKSVVSIKGGKRQTNKNKK
jgi:centrosomal protein CEP76